MNKIWLSTLPELKYLWYSVILQHSETFGYCDRAVEMAYLRNQCMFQLKYQGTFYIESPR
jgi:hypothetical protein